MASLRSFFLVTVLTLLSALLVSCGGGSSDYGDIIHDKAAMAKLEDALKAFGKDKEVMIFQGFSLTFGSANINMQDPDDPDKVVQQVWDNERGWKTVPVTLTGDGDLGDNLNPMSAFNFEGMVDFVLAAEKLMKDKGHKDFRLVSVNVKWSWNDGSLSLMTAYPVGEPGGKQANFEGTMDGKVTKAEISGFNEATKQHEIESLL